MLKLYSFGMFVLSGWQNLIGVLRFVFWMEVQEVITCTNIEPMLPVDEAPQYGSD